MAHAQDLNPGGGAGSGSCGCSGLSLGGSLRGGSGGLGSSGLLGSGAGSGLPLRLSALLGAGNLNLVSGLLARRLDVLKHAQHGGHARLVVVGAQRARREVLKEATHAKKQQGQRAQDANDPNKTAEGLGQEAQDLEQGANSHAQDAVAAGLPQQRQVLGHRGAVKRVLMRGVVVGNNHDGSGALLDLLAAALVERNDVLATRSRAQIRDNVGPQKLKDKQGRRHRYQEKPDGGKQHRANTRQENPQEDEDQQRGGNEVRELTGVELLDVGLAAVLAHHVGDGLGRLEFFLATCRSDSDLLVQIVHIVVCHGHMPYVLFGRS